MTDNRNKAILILTVILFFILVSSSFAEDSFFDSDGVKIHYIVEGKGEPLLLIHGFGGSIEQMGGAIKGLSNNFQVIAVDVRGHGKSEKPHDPDAYGMNVIDDQIRLLDHLKIKKAHVSGYSMGGAIAIGIVGFHPERTLSTIVGGAGWVPPGQVREMPGVDWDEFAESLEQGKGASSLVLALIPEGEPKPTPEELEMFTKGFKDPMALAALIRNFVPSPSEAQIRSNKVPVLALIGEKDPGKKDVDRLDGLMPNLKIVVIPNASHGTAPIDPLFGKSMNDFLFENSTTKVEDAFFDSDGVKIHYVVAGKGEPFLLLHGFGGSAQENSEAIKYLSKNFQVISVDVRGHGKSGKPHDPDAYGMNLIDDQIRLLDHLKIKKAHVAGFSMGGVITLGMLGSHPERILSAIVGLAGWVPPDQNQDGDLGGGLRRSDLAESLEQGKGISSLALALIPEGEPKPTPEELEMMNKGFMATQDPLALAALLRNFNIMPTEEQIRSNKVPVLALIGEKDPHKKDVDRLDGLMPNLKIVVIPNAGHSGAITKDPLFGKSMYDFLAENSKSALSNIE